MTRHCEGDRRRVANDRHETEKRNGAEEAARLVEDERVGLGTGSTVAYLLAPLARTLDFGSLAEGVTTIRARAVSAAGQASQDAPALTLRVDQQHRPTSEGVADRRSSRNWLERSRPGRDRTHTLPSPQTRTWPPIPSHFTSTAQRPSRRRAASGT